MSYVNVSHQLLSCVNSLKLTPAGMLSLCRFKALLGMQNCPDFYITPNSVIK